MDSHRKNDTPSGLSFLMWPALVRAPWLLFRSEANPGLSGRDRYGRPRKPDRY